MSSSASEIREIQDMIEEFEALLTEGDLTSEEEIEIEDAILELNEELSVLRGNDTVPTASASSSSVALPSPTNVIQSATMIPKAIETLQPTNSPLTMAENGSSPLSTLAITMIATGLVAALIVVGIVYYLYRRSGYKNENRESMADVMRDRQSVVIMSPKAIHSSASRGNDSYVKSNDGFSLYVVPSPTDYAPASPSPLSSNRWSSTA